MKNNVSSLKSKIAYGCGDLASNLVFQMMSLYMMYFYTDVFGITAVAVGSMLLLSRVVDAVADIFIGIMIDKTDTKWGKCRPYFLFVSIPLGVIAVLAFNVPNLAPTGKLIYAYVTYILLCVVYDVINIPITAMLPSLTDDPQERTMYVTVRMILSLVGATIVSAMAMPMIQQLGGGNQKKGFLYTIIIFAVLAVGFFMFTFKGTEEKIKSKNPKIPFSESLKAIKGNTPWIIIMINTFFIYLGMLIRSSCIVYFFTYNVSKPALIALIATISTFSSIPGTIVLPVVSQKVGKANSLRIGYVLTIVGSLIMFLGITSVPVIIFGLIVSGIGSGLTSGARFSMLPDTVDYGEWISGVRAQGILSSISSFAAKLAMGVAGAVSSFLLAWGGYIPKVKQTSKALFAIQINFIWIPIIVCVIGLIIMMGYNLDKNLNKIQEDLNKRNAVNNN